MANAAPRTVGGLPQVLQPPAASAGVSAPAPVQDEAEEMPIEEKRRRGNEARRKKAMKLRLGDDASPDFWDELKSRFKMQEDLVD